MSKPSLATLALAFTLVAVSASATEVETIVLFNPEFRETPESIEIDRHGNIFVSFNLTGEIRKIAPDGTQSTFAVLPLHQGLQPCQNLLGRGSMGGIAPDYYGNVYSSVNSCDAADLGIWKITPDGEQSLLANLPGDLFPPGHARPNGIAYHDGWLYVADSALGLVWRLHSDGEHPAEVWTEDPLLHLPSGAPLGAYA
jgi:sugar lactone lactonase YvrE